MAHKIKIYRNLVLPKSMDDKLTALTKGKTLMNCYYLLWALMSDFRENHKNLETYKPLPTARLLKMIGAGYTKPLYILLDNGLIQRTDYYATNKCYSYRFNPEFFSDKEIIKVKFTYTAKMNGVDYRAMKSERQLFLEAYRELDIPFLKLYAKIKDKVANLSLNDYTIGTAVHWEYANQLVYEINNDWESTERMMTKENALLQGAEKGKIIVQDGNRTIMVEPKYFIETKKSFIKLSWTAMVDNLLSEQTLYAKRNKTNNRLDTNFTNMSSELFDIIMSHNNREQLDIQNSQPALLSHVLIQNGIEGEDVKLFNQLTQEGKFYEHFMKYGKTRKQAKIMMFNILFGERFSTKMARLFVKEFPTVANFIRAYKKEHGYNQFSIMLQKLESNIFIDNIFYPLSDEGLKIFTKHDSAIYKVEDKDIVRTRVQDVFSGMNFKASIKEN